MASVSSDLSGHRRMLFSDPEGVFAGLSVSAKCR